MLKGIAKGLSFLRGQEVLTRRLLQRCMDCDAQCVEDVFTLFDGQVLVNQLQMPLELWISTVIVMDSWCFMMLPTCRTILYQWSRNAIRYLFQNFAVLDNSRWRMRTYYVLGVLNHGLMARATERGGLRMPGAAMILRCPCHKVPPVRSSMRAFEEGEVMGVGDDSWLLRHDMYCARGRPHTQADDQRCRHNT